MSLLDKLRRRVGGSAPGAPDPEAPASSTAPGGTATTSPARAGHAARRASGHGHPDDRREQALRDRLHEDPNDEPAFVELVGIVRRRASENHAEDAPARAEDDAVWALAEEMAGSSRAWYPLLELGRLSLRDDHDGAMRRLSTAAERDPSGRALTEGIAVLREAGMPGDALGLGVGHWRPRDHRVDAGVQLVHAAVEAGRVGEARRHLQVLQDSKADAADHDRVEQVRVELERVIAGAERSPRA